MNSLPLLLRPALLVAVLALVMGAVVQAAGSATIRDDAGLFTSAGRSAIERAADQNNVHVVVITNRQSFPSLSAWHAWLHGQATDPNAITIGLHAVPRQKNVYVMPGAHTGISQNQANQGVRDTLRTFNNSGPAEGVIQLIQTYHSMGTLLPQRAPAALAQDARRDWLRAQVGFLVALNETAALGESVSHERDHWRGFLVAFAAYMRTSVVWQMGAAHLQHDLNASGPTMGYVVQEWRTPVGRLRLITLANHGKPSTDGGVTSLDICPWAGLPTLYAAQVLVWAGPSGALGTQVMWQERGTGVGMPVVSDEVLPAGHGLPDLRAWRSARGRVYLAVVEQTICANHSFAVAGGATLAPGAKRWAPDPVMFPSDLMGGTQVDFSNISFADTRGLAVRIEAPLPNTAFGECHACNHIYGIRTLYRGDGDIYHSADWQIKPSPYVTLVEAVVRARHAQQGGVVDNCWGPTLDGLVSSAQVATAFCASDWAKANGVVGVTYSTRGRVILTVAFGEIINNTSTHVVRVTLAPDGSTWLIMDVQGRVT